MRGNENIGWMDGCECDCWDCREIKGVIYSQINKKKKTKEMDE